MHKVIRVKTGNRLRTSVKKFFPSVYTLFKFTDGNVKGTCYCWTLVLVCAWIKLAHLISLQ